MPSPKSKSPKGGSSKSSPNKKGSPGKKNSPNKKTKDTGPPQDAEMQTDPNLVCYLCLRTFKDAAAIQAHIVVMNHMAPYNAKEQHCRVCQSVIMRKDVESHKCAVMKATYLRFMTCSVLLDYGPPYRCLLCRSRPFPSRTDLALHLMCYHRPNKPAGKCGLCLFTYEEPPALPAPHIPALPANADEEKKKAYAIELKAATEDLMCEMPLNTSPGLDSLNDHVMTEHVPAYTLLHRRKILQDTSLRSPYACPICGWQLKSNYAFHAHILCCHGNAAQVENDLMICAMCNFAAVTHEGLNQHVYFNHIGPLKRLGNLWIRKELLMNVTDPGTTCAYCWQDFKYDFQLQAHLLSAHTTNNPLRCGWCKVDFISCPDPILAFMIMQHHEINHGITLHQTALDCNYTYAPLPEPLPEVPDKEQLVQARLGLSASSRADSPSKGKKGKKSPSKSSPKSDKSKKSPKSGSKSPKSGSKK